jgi:hypothetical protein
MEDESMSRDAAKIIMEIVIRNAAEQDAVLTEIQPLCGEDEFNEYRRMIGKIHGSYAIRDHKSNCRKIS